MRVGSLVYCQDCGGFDELLKPLLPNVVYTIRELRMSPYGTGIAQALLEEVTNTFDMGYEVAYGQFRFREIEFPPSLEEEIKDCLEVKEVA